jgi:hypothetical protein
LERHGPRDNGERGQSLLRQPPRLQETGEVAALPELRDAQIDGPGAGLPHPVAVAVALDQPLGRDSALERTLSVDHSSQKLRVGALLHQRAQLHHRFCHLGHSSVQANKAIRP